MARASRPLPLFLAALGLLLLGATWSSVETSSYLPRLAIAAGALLLVIFFIQHAREIGYFLAHARSHAEPGPTTTLLLMAVVLGLASVVAANRLPYADLTGDRLNSLSRPTRNTLAALEGTLRLDGFFIEGSPQWELARRYLEIYERSSTKVETSLVDPDRNPARAREAEVAQAGVVAISYGQGRTKVLDLTEEAITQGILRVIEGRPRRVALIQGHGEPRLAGGGEDGITAWMQSLAGDNIEVVELNLLASGAVPPGVSAMLLVHPRRPLHASEVSLLREFLWSGGGWGVWTEPYDSLGLEPLLRFSSLRLLPGTIRDDGPLTARLGLGPWSPALATNPRHEIGVGLAGAFIVAPAVRPVMIVTPHPADLLAEPLLRSAPTATVHPGPGRGDDLLADGVQTAGVALEWETATGTDWRPTPDSLGLPPVKPKARLVVMGDASMVTNRYLGVGGNQALARNAVHWLTWQERFLGIGRQPRRSSELKVGPGGLRSLLYVIQIGLPLALVLLGAAVWLRRRAQS